MSHHYTSLAVTEVKASGNETGDGASASLKADSVREVELWVDVTAVGPGNFDFRLEASLDDTNWVTVKTIAAVAAVSLQAVAAIRGTDVLGTFVRGAWTQNSGNMTFSINIGKKE